MYQHGDFCQSIGCKKSRDCLVCNVFLFQACLNENGYYIVDYYLIRQNEEYDENENGCRK
jgi:hypothetical protein